MITLLLLFLLTVYGGGMTMVAYKNHQELAEVLRMHGLASSDDDVINYLEASQESSSSARVALKLLNSWDEENEVLRLEAHTPEWKHNPDKHTPCDEQWKLTEADLDRCPDDGELLKAVEAWSTYKFTMHERDVILSKFDTSEFRVKARDILFKKRERATEKKTAKKK